MTEFGTPLLIRRFRLGYGGPTGQRGRIVLEALLAEGDTSARDFILGHALPAWARGPGR